MISPVFWNSSHTFAFQKVGKVYRVYDADGEFIKEFDSFDKLCDFFKLNERIY